MPDFSESAEFITLTYEDSKLPRNPDTGFPTLVKRDVQNFYKRLRLYDSAQRVDRPTPSIFGGDYLPLSHYTVGEYGETYGRPHYHGLVFNLHPVTTSALHDIWPNGFIHVGEVSGASINYVAGYMMSNDLSTDGTEVQKPFALMSKGIGKGYLQAAGMHHKRNLSNVVINRQGMKQPLPRYYRDKIFNIREKEELAARMIELGDEADAKLYEQCVKESPFKPYEYQVELIESNLQKVGRRLTKSHIF